MSKSYIVNYIYSSIVRGDLKHGDRILSIRCLSSLLNVSSCTVSSAYLALARDNIILKKKGIGYYVSQIDLNTIRKNLLISSISTFLHNMRDLGIEDIELYSILNKSMACSTDMT